MARPKKPWSKTIEEAGITLRLYERADRPGLHREFRHPDGRRDRKALEHGDRQLGEQQMRQLARRIAELRLTGLGDAPTLGQLIRLYQAHRAPQLSQRRRDAAERMYAPYFLSHLGDAFALENLSQTQIDGYAAARRSGAVKSTKHRGVATAPRDGTIRNELTWLKSVVKWARGYKVNGRRLLTSDPFEGLTLPQEKNVRRPVASEERYRRTMGVAERVDASGRLACMLSLARYTGRRVNAICQLRAEDVFLSREQAVRALAAAGMDEGQADHMPHGAIAWRETNDKLGFFELTAISAPARAALERYLRLQPALGSALLFPNLKRREEPISKIGADHLLRRAEQLAKLPKFDRGLWHPYRRAWASSRKHLPDVDVAKGGGWRDLATMKASYQQADPATTLKAIENEPDSHQSVTARERSGDGSTA
jgi:integrase